MRRTVIKASIDVTEFERRYRYLNSLNRSTGEYIDSILEKYMGDDINNVFEAYKVCSREDKQLIENLLNANAQVGTVEYVKHIYSQARDGELVSADYSKGVVDIIDALIQAKMLDSDLIQ